MKIIGIVTEEEKNRILELYEKKIALENLSKVLDPTNTLLYEKMVVDYGKNIILFNDWWSEKKKNIIGQIVL